MGTIEEGLGSRSWKHRLALFFRRFKLPLILFFAFALLGLGIRLTLGNSLSSTPSNTTLKTIDISTSVLLNSRYSGELKLARIEITVLNYGNASLVGANVSLSLKSNSSTASNSILVNIPKNTGRPGQSIVQFFICNPDLYANYSKTSYLRDQVSRECKFQFPGVARV